MNKTGKPQRICAIDASTNSLAYALFIDKELNQFGKINFEGNNVYEKVGDAARKTLAYFDAVIETDAIVIEHTVFMNSPKTAADLALVQGALLGAAAMYGIKTIGRVSPITWQNYLGNKKLTKEVLSTLQVFNSSPRNSLMLNPDSVGRTFQGAEEVSQTVPLGPPLAGKNSEKNSEKSHVS